MRMFLDFTDIESDEDRKQASDTYLNLVDTCRTNLERWELRHDIVAYWLKSDEEHLTYA